MDHFIRHGPEWGNKFKNAQQYLRAANDLLHRSGSRIYQFTSSQGWIFKYDDTRNEFLLISPPGTISSFFRPIEGILYWIEQVKKYGK